MAIVNLQGKYVPVKDFKFYTFFVDTKKIDPKTDQRIGVRLNFKCKMIVDCFNNVYLLPQIGGDNDKATFSFTDIVEAASGDEYKMLRIELSRNDLIDIYNADLLGEEWMDYFWNVPKYDPKYDGGKTVKIDLEEDIKKRLHEDVKLPKHVSSYEDLAKKPEQVAALAASARPLERKQK